VKCIFALILVLIIFKHPECRIQKNCVDMRARDGRGSGVQGGVNGATAPGIQDKGASKE